MATKPRGRPNLTRPKIIDALEVVGDMTAAEISQFCGVARRTVEFNMLAMLEAKLVHVPAWDRPSDRRGDPAAVYRLGPGRNAPKPRPLSKREKLDRHHARKRKARERVRIKGRLKRRSAYVEMNPFAAMAVQLEQRS